VVTISSFFVVGLYPYAKAVKPRTIAVGNEVTHQPAPAATLNGRRLRVQLLLEGVEPAKVALDELLELTPGELAALSVRGREVLPEEGVVDVPTTVELERGLERDALLGRARGRVLLLGRVQPSDVSLMVLGMVESHNLRRDVRLESLLRYTVSEEPMLYGLTHEHHTRTAAPGGCAWTRPAHPAHEQHEGRQLRDEQHERMTTWRFGSKRVNGWVVVTSPVMSEDDATSSLTADHMSWPYILLLLV
jgi:hypothetical protein